MSVFKRTRDSYGTTAKQPPQKTSTVAPPPPPLTQEPPRREVPPTTSPDRTSESSPASDARVLVDSIVPRDSAAIIDRKTDLTGTLHSKGNILIEGRFQGDIEAQETVLVDKDAHAKGHVSANDVIVSGSFDGEILCQHRLHITSTASIRGEIKTPILVIEEGSTVDCRFEMSREGR